MLKIKDIQIAAMKTSNQVQQPHAIQPHAIQQHIQQQIQQSQSPMQQSQSNGHR